MKNAISERLADLERLARRLQDLVDSECPQRPLPGMVLARLAVEADRAANALQQHLGLLRDTAKGVEP
jgi:hypothetical protein